MNDTQIVFIPGEVSINEIAALKKAATKMGRWRPSHLSKRYIQPALTKLEDFKPSLKRAQDAAHPVRYKDTPIIESRKDKAARIKRELIDAGITAYGLWKPESRTLPKVLHSDEHIEAIVYGQHRSSSVMLVASNERIIFLDKKPMALRLDEVTYDVVSGLQFEIHTFFATLVLHTPVKNYDIRYANLRCAENFARHIEAHRLKRAEEKKAEAPLPVFMQDYARSWMNRKPVPSDMAGYYWLPMAPLEEEDVQEQTSNDRALVV